MAVLERVATLVRANLNDLIDRAEDPSKMIKQVILDMENQLLQVKTQVAISMADQHLLEKKQKESSEARPSGCARRSWPSTRTGRPRARRARALQELRADRPRASAEQVADQRAQVATLKSALGQARTEAGRGAGQERHAARPASARARARQGERCAHGDRQAIGRSHVRTDEAQGRAATRRSARPSRSSRPTISTSGSSSSSATMRSIGCWRS